VTWLWQAIKFLLLIAFVIIGIRGHLGLSKPLGIADVYKYAKTSQEATLMLNGVFTGYHVWRKGGVDIKNNYPLDKAIKNTQELLIAKGEIVPDQNYPLMRVKTDKQEKKKLNFVIVMLEGWNPLYILPETTPIMAQIQKESVNFTNAYAVGLRSILGFAAIFASVPLVPGLPVFGYGLELTTFSPPFKNFTDNGYYTFFAQTSLRHSFRLCSLANYLGAQGSYGWEDMPMILDYIDEAPYGYDYELFMFAADKIKERKQDNFFAGLFTGITHRPWTRTQERFVKHDNTTWEGGYFNTLAYADWSIGEFLKRAKEDGWFDNTVFIFVSDHNHNDPQYTGATLKEQFHIPLMIYAPKILEPREINYIVSQTDIVPTLYNLAGLNMPYSAFGKDLFDDSTEHPAFVSEGVNIGLVDKDGAIRSDRTSILEEQKFSEDYDSSKALEKLLSLDKAAYELLQRNKWFKNE
jgi:phosphoglycerol transferase MdoB-like AlkP superfamily enzyme